jgi:uncharacterized protein with HEPN domain
MKPDARGDKIRLADILHACRRIKEDAAEGKSEFLTSPRIQDAIVRNFEVIGEAAGKLSSRLRSANPQVGWSEMRGFASFAKHEYWAINPERLWAAVQEIPPIERSVSKIRAEFED